MATKNMELTIFEVTKLNEDMKVLDFVKSSRVSTPKPKKIASEPLKIDPVTGQSQLDDDYFAIETRPEQIVRKKVSLDMDVFLHKNFKKIAVENDVNLYILIEKILFENIKNQR